MKGDEGLSHNSMELKENKMEKNKMKKLMFLTMIIGLMMVFSGSASAQFKARINNVDGNGKFKPVVGNIVVVAIKKETNPTPGFGLKPGDTSCALGIHQTKGQSANAFFFKDCKKSPLGGARGKILRVENPKNQDIIIGDDLEVVPGKITVSRGGKQTMILHTGQ